MTIDKNSMLSVGLAVTMMGGVGYVSMKWGEINQRVSQLEGDFSKMEAEQQKNWDRMHEMLNTIGEEVNTISKSLAVLKGTTR